MSRCCRCGCDKINFKKFDFTSGSVLWQRLLYWPMLATDGDVYAAKFSEPFNGFQAVRFATFDTTLSVAGGDLPSRAYAATTPWFEYSVDRHDATTGEIVGNSGWFGTYSNGLTSIQSNTPNEITSRGLTASAYQVNDDGNVSVNQGGAQFRVTFSDPGSAQTDITYWFSLLPFTSGTVYLRNDNGDEASLDLYDDAATVAAEITTEFGAEITSVTVSGDSLATSGLKITIDWADNTKYMDEIELDRPGSGTTSGMIGNVYLRSLRTGIRGTHGGPGKYSSSYLGEYAWQDNGSLFRRGANPSDATQRRYESWDTSTQPWTLDWSDTPFVGKTAIVPGESGLNEIELVAAGGICGISFPYTSAFSDVLVNRMSVITWNDDGTGREEYHNSGNNFTGYHPNALCIQDGGDDLVCHSLAWRDVTVANVHGSGFSDNVYLELNGQATTRWTSGSGYSLGARLSRGDGSATHVAGFDNTYVALCDIQSRNYSGGQDIAEPSTDTAVERDIAEWVTEEGSGILHSTTLVEMDRWVFNYQVFPQPNGLADTATDWRLKIQANTGGASETTAWFSYAATLATVNAELLSVFGSDTDGTQNVLASVGSAPSTVAVPLYRQTFTIRCHGAKNDDEESEMGTHEVFTLDVGNANSALGQNPDVWIETQNYALAVPYSLGARKWSDGAVEWNRNFNSGSVPRLVYGAQLHSGGLYVLSTKQCSETTDLTLSIGLAFASDELGGWDITATLTITNNTAVSVDVEINAASFNPSMGITWSVSSVTIAAGATDATVTGTYNVGSADTYTISGQVQGVETGETAPTYYSNVDSESIAVS